MSEYGGDEFGKDLSSPVIEIRFTDANDISKQINVLNMPIRMKVHQWKCVPSFEKCQKWVLKSVQSGF